MNDKASAPTRLVVALDGSRLAETALPLVRVLAAGLKGQIILLHVLEHHPPTKVHGEPHLTSVAAAEAYLSQLARQLQASGTGVATHVHATPTHDVAGTIAAHATELQADLIALAAHGRGGVREWLVGRVPQQVVAKAGRPILIVPVPTERDLSAIRRIMLPVDLAGEAHAAVPQAYLMANACRARLILTTVVPTPDAMPGDAGVAGLFLPQTAASLLKFAEEEAGERLEQLKKVFVERGLAVETDLRRGNPAHEIMQAIVQYDADLVIMATHARAGLDGLLAGSVTPRVVMGVDRPLLLVPLKD